MYQLDLFSAWKQEQKAAELTRLHESIAEKMTELNILCTETKEDTDLLADASRASVICYLLHMRFLDLRVHLGGARLGHLDG